MEPENYYSEEDALKETHMSKDCTIETVGKFKVFYKVNENPNNGFELMALNWCQSDGDGSNSLYEITIRVTAYFDGVRHCHLSRYAKDEDMRGYDYYPNIESYILLFQKIRELEKLFCNKEYID